MLSGVAYGTECGNTEEFILTLTDKVCEPLGTNTFKLYDKVIYLKGDSVGEGLKVAMSAKQEFEAGDAIEARGPAFMMKVSAAMDRYSKLFPTFEVFVGKEPIPSVLKMILEVIDNPEWNDNAKIARFIQNVGK